MGYVLAVVIITCLVWLGVVFIKTSGQLTVVATSSLVTIVILEAIQIRMRKERYTIKPERFRHFPTYISRGEQKIFQVTVIWTTSLLILVAIKWLPF